MFSSTIKYNYPYISTLSLLYIVFHHFGYSPLWLQMAIGIATPVFPTQMVYHVRGKI